MPAPQAQWIELLCNDARITSLVSSRELREAVVEVGEHPSAWSLQVGDELAEKVGSQLPEIGRGTPAFTAFRSAMQSAVLSMVVAVHMGAVSTDSLTDEARHCIRVCVSAGIELTSVLSAVRRGHALLVERLMQECRAHAPASEQSTQFALISEITFGFVGQLADGLAQLYLEEHRQWLANPLAVRLELIDRILEGHNEDLAEAAAGLRYEISHRHHIAICVWSADEHTKRDDELETAAMQFLLAHRATQTLIARQPDATVLAWGNSPTPCFDPVDDGFAPGRGIRLAVGTPGWGADGFRSSLVDAREAQAAATRLPGLRRRAVLVFSEVSLLGLLGSDPQRARRFVEAELGALAAYDDHTERLLETLAAYLDSHSPQAVSHQLLIARNTVSYRLQKVQELLKRPITDRQPELRAAIMLARALRDHHEGNEPSTG